MKRQQTFKLTAEMALAHAGDLLAIDPRAIGRAFALAPDEPENMEPFDLGGEDPETVGVVEIHGPLTQRATVHMCGYSDGYDAIAERFEECMYDESVTTVVMLIDSPGGDVAGLFDAVERMQACKAEAGKRVIAFADEMIASAAYALATVADEIYLPRSGQVGSVGVMGIHVDETQAAAKAGLKFTVFRSGPRKAEGNPIEPLTEEAAEAIQDRIDGLAEQFFELVAESRGMTPAAVAALEGAMFSGRQAVKKGLADGLATKEQVMKIKAKKSETDTTQPMPPAGPAASASEPAKSEDSKADEDMEALKNENKALKAELDKMRKGKAKSDAKADDDEDEDEDDDDDDPPSSKDGASAKPKADDAKALKAENDELKLKAIVDEATRAGRVTPAERKDVMAYGRSIGADGLKAFLALRPMHAVKDETREIASKPKVSLTALERKVAAQLGITEDQFATGKAEALAARPKETDQ